MTDQQNPVQPLNASASVLSRTATSVDVDAVISTNPLTLTPLRLITLRGIAVFDFASTSDNWQYYYGDIFVADPAVRFGQIYQNAFGGSLSAIAQYRETWSGWALDAMTWDPGSLKLTAVLAVKGGNGDSHIYRINYFVNLVADRA